MKVIVDEQNFTNQLALVKEYKEIYSDSYSKLLSYTSELTNPEIWSGTDADYFVKAMESFFDEFNSFGIQIKYFNDFIEQYFEGEKDLDYIYENKDIDLE